MIRTDDTERLYLSKGEQIIYIDIYNVPQHHIDGIRFLYRQFKKKKPGIIISDTSGYNKNVQIVLYLQALRHLLNKPALILCQEGAEHSWLEKFETWTDFGDEVILETDKPYIKKQVIINTMVNLPAFCRRDWSLVVIDGDDSLAQVLRLPLKADYKIWVTCDDMKTNLDKFARIYKWFYPKEKFDVSEFTPNKNNLNDVIDKAVLLDAFLEDIVVTIQNVCKEEPHKKISRKNKDATGTKIKRSKRKIYDDDEDDIPLSKTVKEANIPTPSTELHDTEIKQELSINNDKRKVSKTVKEANIPTSTKIITEPHKSNEIKHDFSIDNETIKENKEHLLEATNAEAIDSSNSDSQATLYYEPDTIDNSDKIYEMNTLEMDDKLYEPNEQENDSDDTKHDIQDKKLTVDNNDVVNTIDVYNNKSPKNKRKSEDLETSRNETSDEIKTDINRESPSICNELNNLDNKVKIEVNSPTICNDEDMTPDINFDDENEVKINENEQINEVSTSLKRNCVEDRIKEMEEKALKKFKGSLLDSLF